MQAAFGALAILMMTLALSACTSQQPQPLPPSGAPAIDVGPLEREPDTCGAAEIDTLRGQPAEAVEAALELAGLTHRPYRIIAPDGIVTQDYSAARINFHLDANGLITHIACG